MADNQFGLDADYFIRLCAREFNPEVIRNQTPADLARAFARAARTACAEVLREEEFNWEPLRAAGQIRVGDKIRFELSGDTVTRRVKKIIAPGTESEEIIYSKNNNFCLITSMALAGKSLHKNARVRLRAAEVANVS